MTTMLQVAQRAIDLDRASAFYARLLDAEPAARFDPPGLVFFDVGGVRLLLEGGAPPAVIYLRVEDVTATLGRLGPDVTVISEPHVIFRHDDDRLGPAGHDEVHAFIEDSEGNTIGLVAFRAATEPSDR